MGRRDGTVFIEVSPDSSTGFYEKACWDDTFPLLVRSVESLRKCVQDPSSVVTSISENFDFTFERTDLYPTMSRSSTFIKTKAVSGPLDTKWQVLRLASFLSIERSARCDPTTVYVPVAGRREINLVAKNIQVHQKLRPLLGNRTTILSVLCKSAYRNAPITSKYSISQLRIFPMLKRIRTGSMHGTSVYDSV